MISTRFNFNQNIKADSYVYVCEFNKKTVALEFEPNRIFVDIMLEEIENAKRDRRLCGRYRRRGAGQPLADVSLPFASYPTETSLFQVSGPTMAVYIQAVIALKSFYGFFRFFSEYAVFVYRRYGSYRVPQFG